MEWRLQGAGSWLLPFKDGQPPLGWQDTIAYLILPVLLVVSQFVSQKIMTPKTDDPQQQQTQKYLQFLPLLIGAPLPPPSTLSTSTRGNGAGYIVVGWQQ